MLLNAISSQFVVLFPQNFFYEEIRKKWNPIVKRLKLPYESIEDYINASVQSMSFPAVDLNNVEQGQGQFKITYRGGKELEPILDKNLNITFKLSEGFISYWILFEQIEMYREYAPTVPFWPPMYVSFLDHRGFELMVFSFEKIVPTSLSQLDISYAKTVAEFSTFNLGLRYNRYNIKRRIEEEKFVNDGINLNGINLI